MASASDNDTAYILKHGIHREIERILSKVLQLKPDTPYEVMAREFATAAAKESGAIGEKLRRIAAIKVLYPDNLAIKHFDFDEFLGFSQEEQAHFLKIIASGVDCPDSNMGCYAMAPADYDKYQRFFTKVLCEYHGVSTPHHVTSWDLTSSIPGCPPDGRLDLAAFGLPPLSMRVRVGRNLLDFNLPGKMTQDDRVKLELRMCEAFDILATKDAYAGRYYSLTPGHRNFMDTAAYNELVKSHVMFKDMSADPYLRAAGISADWPYGRGCYVANDRKFIVWVGEEDHLRIMCMQTGTVLNEVFDRLRIALDVVNGIQGLKFATSPNYGFVTSCPTNIGTGMRASVHIKLPKLTRGGSEARAKAVARPFKLSVRGLGGEHTPIGADGTVDISPSSRFCIKEAEIMVALYAGIKELVAKEAAEPADGPAPAAAGGH